jgi:hypothetical protein
MKRQRWFALITFILFIVLGVIFQLGISDKWVFPFSAFYGLLLAIGILLWQYTAPYYASLIFKIQSPKSKNAFWISTIILFCELSLGFYGLVAVRQMSADDKTRKISAR